MEEDILNGNNGMIFDAPKDQASYIKVIGVGGGGGNAVNHMYKQGIKGVDFIVCNTDKKSLMQSPVPTKIQLGPGLGAGNNPEVAKKYAYEKADEIKDVISENTRMLFITAGMGGGTGTGAAPVIAEIAKQVTLDDDNDVDKILLVAIVTFPFSKEGPKRKKQAEDGISELRKYVDSIIIINTDKLRDYGNMTMRAAFAEADNVSLTAAKGIAEIITVEGYVAVDFRDVNAVMANSGTALMGAGIASGEKRAMDAIELASTSALLNDNDIAGAKNILLYFSSNSENEITMDEMDAVLNYIIQLTGEKTDIIWGMGIDENLGSNLSITLIATGFEAKKIEQPSGTTTTLTDDDLPKEVQTTKDEITIKHVEPAKTNEHVVEESNMHTFNPAGIYGGNTNPQTNNSLPSNSVNTASANHNKGHVYKLEEDETTTTTMPRMENNDNSDIILKPSQQQYHDISDTTINKQGNINGMKNVGKMDDDAALNRASRISRIHSMLNDEEGLNKLRSIPAYQLLNEDIYQTPSSSSSEVSGSIDANGIMQMQNGYLHQNPD
jgi:cell division protein FtsZ